jgi:hypothetical protein
MSARPDRKIILCIGVPGTGKTTMTDRICDAMMMHAGYDSIFVLDPLEQRSVGLNRHIGDLEEQLELLEDDEERVRAAASSGGLRAGMAARRWDGPILRTVAEYSEYCGLLAAARESKLGRVVPPRVIWRCGPNPAAYAPAIAEACNQGNTVLVLSESRLWYRNFRSEWPINEIPGREDLTMEHLLTMGRAHIRDRHGVYCPVHLVLDAQDFMMLHNMVRKFTTTVLCSRLEGGEAFKIIQAEFGDGTKALVEKVRKLKNHEWIAVRGEMPELGPFRGGGR